jgi:autotransporter-associated beta strand protein
MKAGLRYARLSAAGIAILYGASRAAADNLVFDPLQTGSPTGSDGSANWDTSTPVWYSQAQGGDVAFNSSTPDSVILGGYNIARTGTNTSDALTLTQNLTVQNITFNTSSTGAFFNIQDDFGGDLTLTLAGNITKAAGFGQPQFYLTNAVNLTAGNHVIAANDTAADNAPEIQFLNISGTANLTGAGSITIDNGAYSQYGSTSFSSDNTYTGGTNIVKGRLEILTGGGLGSGLATISSQGNLSFGGSGYYPSGNITVNTPIVITRNTYVGADYNDYPDAITATNGGGVKTITIAGPLTVDSTDARIAANTNTIVISSNVAQGADVAAGVLTLDGDYAGFITLSGDNTALKGGLALIGGVELNASTEANLAGATSTLNLSGGTIHPTGSLLTDGFMNNFGGHNVSLGSSTVAGTLNSGIDIDAGQTFNASNINAVALGTRGTGTINFNGVNTFSGGPFFDAGTVNVNGNSSFGSITLRNSVLTVTSGSAALKVGGNLVVATGNDSTNGGVVQTASVVNNGGSVTVNGEFQIGNAGNNNNVTNPGLQFSNGTYQMSAGTLSTNSWVSVGRFGGMGTFNISGGTFNSTGTNATYIGETSRFNTSVLNLSGNAVMNVTGGSQALYVGNAGGSGLMTITGTAALRTGNNFIVGNGSGGNGGALGVLNMSGGTITTTNGGGNSFTIGEGGATGVVNLTGGTITDGGELWLGESGGNGTLNISGAATVLTVNSWLALGRNNDGGAGVGTINLMGGTLNAPNTANHITFAGTTNVLNQTGGTLTVGTDIWMGENGTSTYNLIAGSATATAVELGNNGGTTGFLNLSGGTFALGRIYQGGGAGTVNFNGGTLLATGSTTGYMGGLAAANVLQGGAVLNTSTYSIGISQNLLAGTGSTGGLTKYGSGTLTLSGSNSYAGATNVAGGTLTSGNAKALPTGTNLLVASGSNGVNFNGFYPQTANISTGAITLASLTAGGGDTFSFNASSAGIDSIAFSGKSSVTGTNLINLIVPGGTPLTNGTYYLFSDTAGGLGSSFNFDLNGVLASGNTANVSSAGYIYKLTFNASDTADTVLVQQQAIAKLFYTGANGTDMNTLGNYSTDAAGANAAPSAPTSSVDVVLTSNPATNLTPMANGAVAVNSLEFNNSSAVAVGGSGTITVSAGANTFLAGTGIVVDSTSGAGSIAANLSLPVTESFVNNSANPLVITGNTTGTAGLTLSGPFNVSGGLALAGPLAVSGTGGATLSGPISGTLGTATFNNAGGVSLSGANTYTANNVVSAGTVTLGSGTALGSAANSVALANANVSNGGVNLHSQLVTAASLNLSGGGLSDSTGGALLTLSNSGAASAPAIYMPTTGSAYSSSVAAVSGATLLNGTGTKYIVKGTGNGQAVFTAPLNIGSGSTVVALADSSGDAAAEITLAGGVSGTGTLTLANNATLPTGVTMANTADYATLYMSGSNTYSGGTNISYGRIVIDNPSSLGTGTISILIGAGNNSGGTLQLGNSNYGVGSSPLASTAATTTGFTLANPIQVGGATSGNYSAGIINNVGANTLSGAMTLLNNGINRFNISGGSLTITNGISQAGGVVATLAKVGGNTLTLAGSNTYTGQTIISAGTLSVSDLENGGVASNIGASPVVATGAVPNLLLNGGTLLYTGAASSTNRGYQIQASSTLNTGTGSLAFGGQILATGGSFTKIGSGTVSYTNTAGLNTFETNTGYGSFLVNQGTVVLGTPGATASGQTNSIPGELDVSGTGALGYAEMDVNGGTTNVGGYVTISRGNSTTNLTSTFNLNGDAVLNSSNASFGYSNGLGSYNASGTVGLNGTSTWTDTGVFRVAESTGSTIVVNMGGTSKLTVAGGANNGLQVGYQGSGTFNQAGGTVVTTNPVQLGSNVAAASGSYTLGNGAGTNALLRTVAVNGGAGTSTFTFNGGTLQANGSGSAATFVSGLTHAYIAAGPAVIDTNAYSVTVPQVLATSPTVTTDAGLTKTGSGTLTLSGANTFNGPTLVNVGTLATGTTGTVGTGNVTVGTAAAGAVLTLGNGTSIADTATVSFYDTSTVNLNAAGGTSETILALTNLTTNTTFATPGTYTTAQLDAQFNDAVFANASGETFTIVGTPEPASLALLGGAVAPLVLGRRRRKLSRASA